MLANNRLEPLFRNPRDVRPPGWNGKPFDQYERFFVARTSDSDVNPVQPDGYVSNHKWWSLDEMQPSRDEFAPRNIRNLLAPILAGEYPGIPFDCGV
jgi:hypothetical protein